MCFLFTLAWKKIESIWKKNNLLLFSVPSDMPEKYEDSSDLGDVQAGFCSWPVGKSFTFLCTSPLFQYYLPSFVGWEFLTKVGWSNSQSRVPVIV